jgi:ABC-type transport system involved in cytochrome c biogenesis ATPase subunit
MSLSLLSLENLAHHLSSHTWGIKVTLNDLENLTQYENVDRKKQSKKKTQTKLMYASLSPPPPDPDPALALMP